jgi:hypothetical protein
MVLQDLSLQEGRLQILRGGEGGTMHLPFDDACGGQLLLAPPLLGRSCKKQKMNEEPEDHTVAVLSSYNTHFNCILPPLFAWLEGRYWAEEEKMLRQR